MDLFWIGGEAGDEGSGGVFVHVVKWDGFAKDVAEVFLPVERGDFLLRVSILRVIGGMGVYHREGIR